MRQRLVAGFILLFAVAALAAGESDTRPAAPSDTPKQALKSQDAAARAGDVQGDLAFYQADDESQKTLATAMAHGDVAVAKLQAAVEEHFGKDLGAAIARAAGSEDAQAVDHADEQITGDRATVQFPDQKSSVPMVRADGKWKISLADWSKGLKPEQLAQLATALDKLTKELDHLTDLVDHDKFRSGEGVRDCVQSLHDQLFNAD